MPEQELIEQDNKARELSEEAWAELDKKARERRKKENISWDVVNGTTGITKEHLDAT